MSMPGHMKTKFLLSFPPKITKNLCLMGVCTSKTEVFKAFYYIVPLIYLIYSVFPPIKSAFFTDFGGVTPINPNYLSCPRTNLG